MFRPLKEFIMGTCMKLGIDESHGLKHSIETVRYANLLMDRMSEVTEEERHMATFVAALHDLCDSKYTNINVAAEEIRTWLLNEMGWSDKNAGALISIVTTMSYSKLRRATDSGCKPVFPDHGKWQLAYEIGRHADLLESYVPARCVMYNRHIFPEKSEDEHWARANELFEDRVFNYVKDGWISLPEAVSLVPNLEKRARWCIQERSEEWPLFSDEQN
jgi:hypothetical protein